MALTDPTLQIRRAEPRDAMGCAQIVSDWLNGTPQIQTPPDLNTLSDAIAKGMQVQQIWVAGDPVEGYLSFGPDEYLIRGFYVGPRRSGIGKALMDHIKTNQAWLHLWTHEFNTEAHRFYKREGFEFSGKTRPGDDGPLELEMIWTRESS